MSDLSTTFMGLKLRNPVVVASSTLTGSVKKVIACEKAGAGAVVLKSLFEEQILKETDRLVGKLDSTAHPEGYDLLKGMGSSYFLDDYLKLVEDAKKRVQIPVIASVNCVTPGSWTSYARRLEGVGADALELNVFILPADPLVSGREIERSYLEIARRVRRAVKIPVAVKLGPHFSGLAEMVEGLRKVGMNGITLFNRFYRPEIDIESIKVVPAKLFSSDKEMALTLQWIALLSGAVAVDFAANTGIHDATAVIKQLLAGARVVELCTALFENGIDYLQTILNDLSSWMDRHTFASPADFTGLLSKGRSSTPELFERGQYIRSLIGVN